jgi:hypothetical protein
LDGWSSKDKEKEKVETHGDSEDSRHAVKVVNVLAHLNNLRDDSLLRPLNPKHLRQLPQVDRRGLTNREDGVAKPAHAEVGELVVEELHAELLCQQGDVLDDGLSDAPLLVFREFDDRGEESL